MNQVDTSPEKVESEWQKIEVEFNLNEVSGSVEGEHIPSSEGGEFVEETTILSADEYEAKKKATKGLISGGLKMAFFMLKVEEIPESVTDEFCDCWAVVIVNRFPDNPVTDFMDAYGDLIAAGGASLVLFGAIRTAKSKKQIQGEIKKGMQAKQAEVVEDAN